MSKVSSTSSSSPSSAPSASKGTADTGASKGPKDTGASKGPKDTGASKGPKDTGTPKTDTTDKSSLTPDGKDAAKGEGNYPSWAKDDYSRAEYDRATKEVNAFTAKSAATDWGSEDIHCAFQDSVFGSGADSGFSNPNRIAGSGGTGDFSGMDDATIAANYKQIQMDQATRDVNAFTAKSAATDWGSEDIHCAFQDSVFGSEGGPGFSNPNRIAGSGGFGDFSGMDDATIAANYEQIQMDQATRDVNAFMKKSAATEWGSEDISCVFGKNNSPFG